MLSRKLCTCSHSSIVGALLVFLVKIITLESSIAVASQRTEASPLTLTALNQKFAEQFSDELNATAERIETFLLVATEQNDALTLNGTLLDSLDTEAAAAIRDAFNASGGNYSDTKVLKALVTQLHERLHALVRHNSVQEAAILTLPDEARELNNRNMRILSDAHPDLVQMLQILDAHEPPASSMIMQTPWAAPNPGSSDGHMMGMGGGGQQPPISHSDSSPCEMGGGSCGDTTPNGPVIIPPWIFNADTGAGFPMRPSMPPPTPCFGKIGGCKPVNALHAGDANAAPKPPSSRWPSSPASGVARRGGDNGGGDSGDSPQLLTAPNWWTRPWWGQPTTGKRMTNDGNNGWLRAPILV